MALLVWRGGFVGGSVVITTVLTVITANTGTGSTASSTAVTGGGPMFAIIGRGPVADVGSRGHDNAY